MYSHVNYIPHNKFGRHAAKATLGYNETRKGKDGEEIVRKLFGKSGPLTREQAEWLIDTASKNTYFFRWILSPDTKEENAEKGLDLWKLARDGVRWLEERLQRQGEIQLIGAEHNDHTEIPHIHAILLIERQGRKKILTGKDLDEFRNAIHQMALDQRLSREQTINQEVSVAPEASVAVQPVQEAAKSLGVGREPNGTGETPPRARHASTGSEIVKQPFYGTRSTLCMVCKGVKGKELIEESVTHCPGCGRTLGWRKEAQLSLTR